MRFLSIVILVLGAALVPVSQVQAADDHIGIIKKVSGSGLIERGMNQSPAAPGDLVFNGDKITTAADSSLGITFKDGSLMSLGPDAQFVMDELVYEPQNGNLSMVTTLLQGTFSHVSGGIGRLSPDSVRFKTPVATIGIRGTRFVVRVP